MPLFTRDPRARTEEDELQRTLRRVGLQEPVELGGRDMREPRAGRDLRQRRDPRQRPIVQDRAEPEPAAAGRTSGGFWRHLREGFMHPFASAASLIPGVEGREQPEPVQTGEHVGRILGQVVGYGIMGSLAAATMGKGAVAAAGLFGTAAKTGVAGSAVKWGTAGAATEALYAHGEDLPPGQIAKHAGYGLALGAGAPVLGHFTRGIRSDAMNKLRKVYARRFGDIGGHPEYGMFGRRAMTGAARGGAEIKQEALDVTKRRLTKKQQQQVFERMEVPSESEFLTTTDPRVPRTERGMRRWKGHTKETLRRRQERYAQRKPSYEEKKRIFEEADVNEQAALLIETLWDDPRARKMMRPILRRTEDSAWRAHKSMPGLLDGNPLFAREHKMVRHAMGQKEGVDSANIRRLKGIEFIPDDIEGRSLRGQLDAIDSAIKRNLQKRHEQLVDYPRQIREDIVEPRHARRWVTSTLGIKDPERAQWFQQNIQEQDLLRSARYELLPSIEDTLKEYRHGTIRSALNRMQQISDEEAAGKHMVKRHAILDEEVYEFLARHSPTMDPEDLTGDLKVRFDGMISRKRRLEGIEPLGEMAWFHNPDALPESMAREIRDNMMAEPHRTLDWPTSADDVLRVTPPNILTKQLAPSRHILGEHAIRPIRRADQTMRKFLKGWEQEWDNIIRPLRPRSPLVEGAAVRGKKARQRILVRDYLDADNREQFLEAVRRRFPDDWTDEVQRIADQTDEMLKRLAKVFDIPEDQVIRHFAPRRQPMMGGVGGLRTIAEERHPSIGKFISEEAREGFLFPQEGDIDVIMRSYIRGGAKKNYLQPAFKQVSKQFDPEQYKRFAWDDLDEFFKRRGYAEGIRMKKSARRKAVAELSPEDRKLYDKLLKEHKEARSLANQFQRSLSDAHGNYQFPLDEGKRDMFRHLHAGMMGESGPTEQLIDRAIGAAAHTMFGADPDGRYVREIANVIQDLGYSATIGFNPFTAVKNLTQQLLSVSHLDENPAVGAYYWARANKEAFTSLGKMMDKVNPVLTGRLAHQAQVRQTGGLSKVFPGWDRAKDWSMWLFQQADRKNVRNAFNMKMLYDLDRGVPWHDAVERAYSHTMATQFMYGVDSPLLYHGTLGKTVGMLMSWPLNYASLLHQQGTHSGMLAAGNTIAAGALLSETLSQSGLSFQSVNPLEVASGTMPVAILEGQDRWPLVAQVAAASGNYVNALIEGDDFARQSARQDLMSMTVPGGVQLSRLWEGIETELFHDGWEFDHRERARFQVDGRERFWRYFGPTEESRRRWEDLQLISHHQKGYRRLRQQALDALLDGDEEKFLQKQDRLVLFYGKGVEPHEVGEYLETAQETSLERSTIGLPKAFSDPTIEHMLQDWVDDPEEYIAELRQQDW